MFVMSRLWRLFFATALLHFAIPVFAVQFTTTRFNVKPGRPFTLKFADFDDAGVKIDPIKVDDGGMPRVMQTLVDDTPSEEGTLAVAARYPLNEHTFKIIPERFRAGEYAFRIEDLETRQEAWSLSFYLDSAFLGRRATPEPSTPLTPASSAFPFTPPPTPTPTPDTTPSPTTSGEDSRSTPGSSDPGETEPGSGEDGSASSPGDNMNDPNNNQDQDQSSGSSGGALSTGAKAGIGAGAGIVGLILLGVLGWFIYRRGQASARERPPVGPTVETSRPELGDPEPKPVPEMEGQHHHVAEVADNQGWVYNARSELPSTGSPPGYGEWEGGQYRGRSELH